MDVRSETKKIFKDYGRNLVNAGIMSEIELKEALSRLNSTPGKMEEVKEHLISKKEAASLLGYKNVRSIDRLEQKGLLKRISSA